MGACVFRKLRFRYLCVSAYLQNCLKIARHPAKQTSETGLKLEGSVFHGLAKRRLMAPPEHLCSLTLLTITAQPGAGLPPRAHSCSASSQISTSIDSTAGRKLGAKASSASTWDLTTWKRHPYPATPIGEVTMQDSAEGINVSPGSGAEALMPFGERSIFSRSTSHEIAAVTSAIPCLRPMQIRGP